MHDLNSDWLLKPLKSTTADQIYQEKQKQYSSQMEELNNNLSALRISKFKTAIELFQEASLSEQAGNIGVAIDLYSRAFRLDPEVERHYAELINHDDKIKEQESGDNKVGRLGSKLIQPVNLELLAEMATRGPKPENSLFPRKPCPLLSLPNSVLTRISVWLGVLHMSSLERMSQTCHKLYLVQRQESLWRQLCQIQLGQHVEYTTNSVHVPCRLQYVYMPKIRTDGVYICRIRYFRPGTAESISSVSFNTPIHLVTYYRYLRFWNTTEAYKCVSYVTTEEPKKTVIDRLREFPEGESVLVGMCTGWYEKGDTDRTWLLHLHDPNMKYRVDSQMTLKVATTNLPSNTTPHPKPSQSLTCLDYRGHVENLHRSSFNYTEDEVLYDVSEWGKFYFSKVKSYLT